MSPSKFFSSKIFFFLLTLSLWAIFFSYFFPEPVVFMSFVFGGIHHFFLTEKKLDELKKNKYPKFSFLKILTEFYLIIHSLFPSDTFFNSFLKKSLFPFLFMVFIHLFLSIEGAPIAPLAGSLFSEIFHFIFNKMSKK